MEPGRAEGEGEGARARGREGVGKRARERVSQGECIMCNFCSYSLCNPPAYLGGCERECVCASECVYECVCVLAPRGVTM